GSRSSALDLAPYRPVGLGRIDEADPDVLAARLAYLDEQLGELLRELLLLLGGAALVPLDRDDRHRLRDEVRLELLYQPALRKSADDLVRRLAGLEEDQRRDRHHVVTRGWGLVV